MRILIVTDTFFPDVNGVAKTLNTLTMGLAVLGHELEVVTTCSAKDAQVSHRKIRVHKATSFPLLGYPGLRWGFRSFGEWLETLKRSQPHVLYIAVESVMGLTALKAAKHLGIPVVTGFHTKFHQYSDNYQVPWMKQVALHYLRYFHNSADRTLVPSLAMKRELEALNIGKIGILGRGVDTKLFEPSYRSEELRKSWGVSEKDPVLLSVGRVAAEKNLDLFFKTHEFLKNTNPRLKAIVVGDGPKKAEYQKRYQDVLFTGSLQGESLAAHFASADLFLFPSLTETYGNVVVEAMASGLVVISFKDAAAVEWIKSGENGFLAEYADEDDFLQKAACGLQQWQNQKLRSLAVEYVKNQSWEGIIRDFEKELIQVIPVQSYSLAS